MPSSVANQRALDREAVISEPLVFKPFLRPSPWGGRRLIERYGKEASASTGAEFFGESWEISGHPLHVSRVAGGTYAGVSLNDLWAEQAAYWSPARGSDAVESMFPLLVKLLDCREPCSVQVHPAESGSAAFDPPQQVKVEAWIVLEAFPDAVIYSGFQSGVTEADARKALAAGSIVDCLNAVTPRVGDCFLITPGVVHAMQGVVLAEFQTTSDATLRLFDWNRTDQDGKPRKLHIEESLREIDFALGPVPPHSSRPLLANADNTVASEVLVEIPEFHISRHRFTKTWFSPPSEAISIWMVADGAVELTVHGQPPITARAGETILVPPSCEQLTWRALDERTAILLRCEVPR
jgi:mannose-6-phosphate isomerase